MHVDDEEDIREVTRLALEQVGHYSVCSCESGAAVFEMLSDFSPEIILLDAMMPILSGQEVFRLLSQMPKGASTPVVFMTARVQPTDIAAFNALGAAGVIQKPFDPMTLAHQVEEIWARHVGA
jgi:two-component system OmpR family response regulator